MQRWIVRQQPQRRAEKNQAEKVQKTEEKQEPEYTKVSFFDKVEAGHV